MKRMIDWLMTEDRMTADKTDIMPLFAKGLFCFAELAVSIYIITFPKLFSHKCGLLIRMAAVTAGWRFD